jgi:hypothetical protein
VELMRRLFAYLMLVVTMLACGLLVPPRRAPSLRR